MKKALYLFKPFCIILIFLSILGIESNAQSWEALNPIPFRNHHSNGLSYDGKAYIIQGEYLGSGPNASPNNLWEYNPVDDSWTTIGQFPGPSRGFAIGDEWDGKYYYGFGSSADASGSGLNDLWVFDPVDQSFTELPECPCQGRAHPALVAQNGKIFMGAGSGNNGNLDDWWEFDLSTQIWTQKPDIPGAARHHPFFFGVDNKVYVGGGHVTNWIEWDMDTETWATIDNLPGGRVAGTQLSYNNKGLILAGDDQFHNELPADQTFMIYDPQTAEWEYMPPLPDASRWAPSSFILDDELYFFGGWGYGGANDYLLWKFDLAIIDCLPPNGLNVLNLTETTADLFWQTNATAALSDTLKWRVEGDPVWNDIPNPQAVYSLTGLEPCQLYEFKIVSACSSIESSSDTYRFVTKSCGACIDLDFCTIPNGLAGATEFIQEVSINGYTNTSGSNGGYGNFLVPEPESVQVGETFELTLTPGFSGGSTLALSFSAWIDFNADGSFASNEKVLFELLEGGEVSKNIMIPDSAVAGITRMRILYGNILPSSPCNNGTFETGEMEDYCLNIESLIDVNGINNGKNKFSIQPNPVSNSFHIIGNIPSNKSYTISIIDVMGKTVQSINNFDLSKEIDLTSFSNGIYFLKIEDGSELISSLRIVKQN